MFLLYIVFGGVVDKSPTEVDDVGDGVGGSDSGAEDLYLLQLLLL